MRHEHFLARWTIQGVVANVGDDARRGEILAMVLRDGARITAIGLTVGLVGALITG